MFLMEIMSFHPAIMIFSAAQQDTTSGAGKSWQHCMFLPGTVTFSPALMILPLPCRPPGSGRGQELAAAAVGPAKQHAAVAAAALCQCRPPHVLHVPQQQLHAGRLHPALQRRV
jgi:hypothetical protein